MPVGADAGRPIVPDAAADLLSGACLTFASSARIGLAVSGGSDSMAMLHLMAQAAPQMGWTLSAVTVDHRLRPEAADEAALVGRICADLGVPHDVLVWDHGVIAGNVPEAARQARYRLMAAWARGNGIADIALAHTADDQAETFLMGLARQAGLDGLSSMRRCFAEAGATFHRPFLNQTRAELRAWLNRRGLRWIDDPSNDNDRYARVKARRALKALAPLGITVQRLSAVVGNLAAAQGVVKAAVADTACALVTETAGALRFEGAAFRQCDPEVARLLLIAMIRWLTGGPYPPRRDQLSGLTEAITAGRDATLGGCRFRQKDGTVTVSREARAVQAAVPVAQVWDHRWRVAGPAMEAEQIRALGAGGLRLCSDWPATGLPRPVLEVTPAVWRGDTLIAAPLAGFGAGWTAKTDPDFASFLLSH